MKRYQSVRGLTGIKLAIVAVFHHSTLTLLNTQEFGGKNSGIFMRRTIKGVTQKPASLPMIMKTLAIFAETATSRQSW